MTLGRGKIMSKSTKQKLNMKSSTEAELVSASNSVPQIVWTNYSGISNTVWVGISGRNIELESNETFCMSYMSIMCDSDGWFIVICELHGELTI